MSEQDETQEQVDPLAELREQAVELGVDVDNRWGEERLQREIDAALEGPSKEKEEPEPEKSVNGKIVVRNVMKGPQAVGVNILQPKEELEVTKLMQEDQRLMSKINHALKTGALKKV